MLIHLHKTYYDTQFTQVPGTIKNLHSLSLIAYYNLESHILQAFLPPFGFSISQKLSHPQSLCEHLTGSSRMDSPQNTF